MYNIYFEVSEERPWFCYVSQRGNAFNMTEKWIQIFWVCPLPFLPHHQASQSKMHGVFKGLHSRIRLRHTFLVRACRPRLEPKVAVRSKVGNCVIVTVMPLRPLFTVPLRTTLRVAGEFLSGSRLGKSMLLWSNGYPKDTFSSNKWLPILCFGLQHT